MYERWTKEQEKIFFENYKEKNLDELILLIDKTREQIKTKAWRNNIILMNVWTQEDDGYLANNYLSMTYKEIGDELHRTKSAIQSRCKKLNLSKSYSSCKKELDSNYFNTINTEEKAYWLGFICADGCISYNKNSKSYLFKITLQESDTDFLKKFITCIGGDFDLKHKEVRLKVTDKVYKTCEVCFKDKVFTSDLLKYFSTNKTEYLRISNKIPQELRRHFIRGFSDGDGCFYCNLVLRNKAFEIIGKCYDMLSDIQTEFSKNNISSSIYKKRETNWKLGIYQIRELVKLQSYLYDGATIFMERKYIKSKEILQLAS